MRKATLPSGVFHAGQRVYWWRRFPFVEPPYYTERPFLATIVAFTKKRIKIALKNPGSDSPQRYVEQGSLQVIASYCEKATKQGPEILEPMKRWGTFTRYVEIGDDLFALRQVDVFKNGKILSYDRIHWVDGFGMLGDLRMNRNNKKGPWGTSVEIEAE